MTFQVAAQRTTIYPPQRRNKKKKKTHLEENKTQNNKKQTKKNHQIDIELQGIAQRRVGLALKTVNTRRVLLAHAPQFSENSGRYQHKHSNTGYLQDRPALGWGQRGEA